MRADRSRRPASRIRLLTAIALAGAVVACNPTASTTPDALRGSASPAGTSVTDPVGELPQITPGPNLGDAWTTAPSITTFIQGADGSWIAPSQYLVMLSPGAPASSAERAAAAVNGTVMGHIAYINVWKIQTAPAPDLESWQLGQVAIGESPDVVQVAPVSLVLTSAAPTCAASLADPVYAGNNADPFTTIGVGGAWDAYYSSGLRRSPVHIGLIDTQLTRDPHGKLPWEFDQVTFDGDPTTTDTVRPASEDDPRTDGFHHADGVLGIIGGDPTNGGVAGIASPLGRSLVVSHDVLGGGAAAGAPDHWDGPEGWSYTDAELLNTIRQIEAGATIINGSWAAGSATDDNSSTAEMWKDFFAKMAIDHPEVLFVYAAGNNNTALNGKNQFPGGIKAPNVITVGNESTGKKRDATSNYTVAGSDAEVTLAAPGDQAVWGRGADGTVRASGGGTSSAAPMVTGTAALIRSLDPTLTAAQIKSIITGSAAAGPAELGGKSLRVDAAVRKAIDGVRQRVGMAALTDDEIAQGRLLCQIGLQASIDRRLDAGSSEWTVVVTLAVVPNVTFVSLMIDGHTLSTPQVIAAAADSTSWTVTVPQAGSTIVVTRLDNGYWTGLKLIDTGQALPSPTPSAKPSTPSPTPARSTPARCPSEDPNWDPMGGLMCPTEVPLVGG